MQYDNETSSYLEDMLWITCTPLRQGVGWDCRRYWILNHTRKVKETQQWENTGRAGLLVILKTDGGSLLKFLECWTRHAVTVLAAIASTLLIPNMKVAIIRDPAAWSGTADNASQTIIISWNSGGSRCIPQGAGKKSSGKRLGGKLLMKTLAVRRALVQY